MKARLQAPNTTQPASGKQSDFFIARLPMPAHEKETFSTRPIDQKDISYLTLCVFFSQRLPWVSMCNGCFYTAQSTIQQHRAVFTQAPESPQGYKMQKS